LQYTDPNAFSRAFRSWATLSPKQWRARQGCPWPGHWGIACQSL